MSNFFPVSRINGQRDGRPDFSQQPLRAGGTNSVGTDQGNFVLSTAQSAQQTAQAAANRLASLTPKVERIVARTIDEARSLANVPGAAFCILGTDLVPDADGNISFFGDSGASTGKTKINVTALGVTIAIDATGLTPANRAVVRSTLFNFQKEGGELLIDGTFYYQVPAASYHTLVEVGPRGEVAIRGVADGSLVDQFLPAGSGIERVGLVRQARTDASSITNLIYSIDGTAPTNPTQTYLAGNNDLTAVSRVLLAKDVDAVNVARGSAKEIDGGSATFTGWVPYTDVHDGFIWQSWTTNNWVYVLPPLVKTAGYTPTAGLAFLTLFNDEPDWIHTNIRFTYSTGATTGPSNGEKLLVTTSNGGSPDGSVYNLTVDYNETVPPVGQQAVGVNVVGLNVSMTYNGADNDSNQRTACIATQLAAAKVDYANDLQQVAGTGYANISKYTNVRLSGLGGDHEISGGNVSLEYTLNDSNAGVQALNITADDVELVSVGAAPPSTATSVINLSATTDNFNVVYVRKATLNSVAGNRFNDLLLVNVAADFGGAAAEIVRLTTTGATYANDGSVDIGTHTKPGADAASGGTTGSTVAYTGAPARPRVSIGQMQ